MPTNWTTFRELLLPAPNGRRGVESELRRLIYFKPGETYSRRMITASSEAMKQRLGFDGYAFATVDPVPTPNNETKEISLTFVVDPKNRVYVRRVNFNGTSGVNDEVFRREMRQFEGSYLSNSAVDWWSTWPRSPT